MHLLLENDFWRFSCTVYAHGAVRDACLALQDSFGVDINLLLFAGWMDHRHVPLTDEDFADISDLVRLWHSDVIVPLRAARRGVTADHSLSGFRDRVMQVELEAEQVAQAMLFRWAAPRLVSAAAGTATANLTRLLRAAAVPGPTVQDTLAVLAAAIRRL